MAKDFDSMEDSNRSFNRSIHAVSDPARRVLLKGGLGASLAGLLVPLLSACATRPPLPLLGFKGVPASSADAVVVPEGYVAQVLAPWGEPVGIAGRMPAWRPDASNSAADQAVQMGMHHDGIHFIPLGKGSERGLLVMNHEYVDDGLLYPDGLATWTADKVEKAQAAHGISVIEVALVSGRWQMVRPSPYARRITATTPCNVGGPGAGHRLLRTAADPAGRTVLGTFNNCASSLTPWGTYLAGEENFAFYFAGGDSVDAHGLRWGLRKTAFFRWPEHDERFDALRHPNEFNRFGWIVEFDPTDPSSTPVKRTALGRAAHEGAWVALTADSRAVVYSGEDARFEYIYKFVSEDRVAMPSAGKSAAQANHELLDRGTLSVARFDADGTGRWLPLIHGNGPLTAANGFADQGEVLVKTRQASDLLGATKMDRPEWIAIDQQAREVYCTLTNNSSRGAAGLPGVDAANPRANNVMGQIIRWREEGDFDSSRFAWSHLLLAGDPENARPEARGNIRAERAAAPEPARTPSGGRLPYPASGELQSEAERAAAPEPARTPSGGRSRYPASGGLEPWGDIFACPDGVTIDARGVLWIETDAHATQMNQGELARIGNNQLLACDRQTGEVRRFLTGPVNCEITGTTQTPDGRTMFINIQHPGETPSDRSDPAQPMRYSRWPDFQPGGRPRSATVAIRKLDGGVIGT